MSAVASENIRSLSTVGLMPSTISIGWTGGRDILRDDSCEASLGLEPSSSIARTSRTVSDCCCSLPLLEIGVSLAGTEALEVVDAASELGASSVKYISCDVKFVA